jgi:3-phosphoshikimate 1-carboxyvinyltransferase
MPDMAQTLAAVALFADGTSTLRGLHTLRVKETDRIAALKKEIEKLGAEVSMSQDTITILPPESGDFRPATIDTYDDHRMAMSFAVVGSKVSGITIRDAQCVQKTYPRFFEDFARLNNT